MAAAGFFLSGEELTLYVMPSYKVEHILCKIGVTVEFHG